MPRVLVVGMVVLSTFALVASADAQCAMCVTALEQNGGELAAGFNRGILFLLGMPYLVVGAIAVGHYLRKKRRDEDRGTHSELQSSLG